MNYLQAFQYGVWGAVVAAGFVVCALGAISVIHVLAVIARMVFGGDKQGEE